MNAENQITVKCMHRHEPCWTLRVIIIKINVLLHPQQTASLPKLPLYNNHARYQLKAKHYGCGRPTLNEADTNGKANKRPGNGRQKLIKH